MATVTKINVVLSTVTLASSLLCSSGATATSAEWQKESQKAFLLLNEDRQPEEAYGHYQIALNQFASSSQHPIALDLELDMVESLIACKRYADAEAKLARVSPIILKAYKGKLLEARYWRRCAHLHKDQKLFEMAAKDQQHLVALIGKILGDDCTDCIDERIILVEYLRKDDQWNSVFDQLAQCDTIIESRKHDINTTRWTISINIILHQFCLEFPKLLDERPEICSALIERFQRLRPDDSRPIDLLISLCKHKQIPEQQRLEAANLIISILQSHKLDYKNADEKLAIYLIKRAVPGSFDSTKGMTPSTIKDIRELNSIADRVVPVASRPSNDLFVQARSLQAAMLAHAGRLDEANSLLNSLQLSQSYFKELTPLTGVLQARKEIAKAYVALGQREPAKKQFTAMYGLIQRFTPPSKKEAALNHWRYQEKYYLVDHWSALSNPNTKP